MPHVGLILFPRKILPSKNISSSYLYERDRQAGNWHFTLLYNYPWRRRGHPTPGLLPGKSHGWRSLVGCSPWGRKESDTTEWLPFHFSLSCIGEGNGNPLQYSCLENPRDGGAWWAAVYGVAQSQTQLKWLSSSSSIMLQHTSGRYLYLCLNVSCCFIFLIKKCIYLFMSSLGLHCCEWAFSTWGKQGLVFFVIHRLLSHCRGFSCCRAQVQ